MDSPPTTFLPVGCWRYRCDQPRSPEHQALVDDYASQSLHILKNDFRAIETIGIMTIARHIGRELLEGDDGHMRYNPGT